MTTRSVSRTATRLFAGGALAAALAVPGLAAADDNVARSQATPIAPSGLSLQLGGGVTGFTREAARDRFGTGGYWDLRGVLGTDSIFGAELAYIGSARDVTASGVDDAALLGNGAEAVARINLPLRSGNFQLAPFAFGGVGWTYYSLTNDAATRANIKDGANAFVIPFGAGASATFGNFVLDARFTYRAVFDDDLVAMGNDTLDLQNWAAGLTLGYSM